MAPGAGVQRHHVGPARCWSARRRGSQGSSKHSGPERGESGKERMQGKGGSQVLDEQAVLDAHRCQVLQRCGHRCHQNLTAGCDLG